MDLSDIVKHIAAFLIMSVLCCGMLQIAERGVTQLSKQLNTVEAANESMETEVEETGVTESVELATQPEFEANTPEEFDAYIEKETRRINNQLAAQQRIRDKQDAEFDAYLEQVIADEKAQKKAAEKAQKDAERAERKQKLHEFHQSIQIDKGDWGMYLGMFFGVVIVVRLLHSYFVCGRKSSNI